MLLFASLVTFGITTWLPIAVASTNSTTLALSKKFTLFSWPVSSSTNDLMMADQSFTFHLDEPAILQLTDYKEPGDMFRLFDDGKSLGKTLRPQIIDEQDKVYAETPEIALKDSQRRFSKGQALLSPGDHSITIQIMKGISNNVSGGGIRLMEAPLKLLQFHKHKDYKDDDYLDFDDDDEEEYEDEDDEEEDDDYYDYTTTLTVVVPPTTPDLWRHRTEPIITMMPAPIGYQGRGGILPAAAQIKGGLEAVTFIPPAGRAVRNPMAGSGRR